MLWTLNPHIHTSYQSLLAFCCCCCCWLLNNSVTYHQSPDRAEAPSLHHQNKILEQVAPSGHCSSPHPRQGYPANASEPKSRITSVFSTWNLETSYSYIQPTFSNSPLPHPSIFPSSIYEMKGFMSCWRNFRLQIKRWWSVVLMVKILWHHITGSFLLHVGVLHYSIVIFRVEQR